MNEAGLRVVPESGVGVKLRTWVDASSFNIFALHGRYESPHEISGDRLRNLIHAHGAMRVLAREGDEHPQTLLFIQILAPHKIVTVSKLDFVSSN